MLEGFSDHRARAPTGRTRILDLMRAPKICFVGLGTFQVLLDFIAFSTQNVKIEDISELYRAILLKIAGDDAYILQFSNLEYKNDWSSI